MRQFGCGEFGVLSRKSNYDVQHHRSSYRWLVTVLAFVSRNSRLTHLFIKPLAFAAPPSAFDHQLVQEDQHTQYASPLQVCISLGLELTSPVVLMDPHDSRVAPLYVAILLEDGV